MSFVVIEGLDGSGKSTQIKLLRNYLEEKQIPYKYLHFPRTGSPVYGELVARFLRGELGKINEVNPYLVALIYAGDRNDAKGMIKKWLSEGYFVLVDRFVISNIAFQCAKLERKKDQDTLKKWIMDLEYSYNKLPVPDINLFLDVPFHFTRTQLSGERRGEDREYLEGASDIHEENLEFQVKVRNVYLSMQGDEGFKILQCFDDDGNILPPEKIFTKIKKSLFENEIA